MALSIDPSMIRSLRRVEYEKLAELGEFGDERIELIYGTLVKMSPKDSIQTLNEQERVAPPHVCNSNSMHRV
jgi:hypothetical protein